MNPTMHRIRLDDDDRDRDLADPKFTKLISDGWTIVGHAQVIDDGEPQLFLFLAPPTASEGSRSFYPPQHVAVALLTGVVGGVLLAAVVPLLL
jgi:hypothetical protein